MYTYMYGKDEQGKETGVAKKMEDTLSIVEAREQLTRLPEQFDEELKTRRNVSAIKVTRHNKPVLAILPWELYESIVETLEILGDHYHASGKEALKSDFRSTSATEYQ